MVAITAHLPYIAAVLLVAIGLYGIAASVNLVKKVIALNIFQVGVFLVFITAAYVRGGGPPIVGTGPTASPLPHVLILTAIVVGVSLTAVALALIVRIYDAYGSLDERVIREVQADE
jgi:multicomponent Na+:H+ antiporter subunit C